MAKQLREIVPKRVDEGWPRAVAMGALETGAAAATAAIVGLPAAVGAGIGAAHYLYANAKDDLAKKSGDWNYGYGAKKEKTVQKTTTTLKQKPTMAMAEAKSMDDLTDEQWTKIHGHRAGKRGQAHTDNPHERGTKLHKIWHDSHQNARSKKK